MAYLRRLDDESNAINKEITEMVIYCNGALSFSEAWEMPMGRAQFYAAFIACTRPNGGPG